MKLNLLFEATAYEILGVSPDAELDEIQRAYRKRAMETHPDKGGGEREFTKVSNAYQALKASIELGIPIPKSPAPEPTPTPTPGPPSPESSGEPTPPTGYNPKTGEGFNPFDPEIRKYEAEVRKWKEKKREESEESEKRREDSKGFNPFA